MKTIRSLLTYVALAVVIAAMVFLCGCDSERFSKRPFLYNQPKEDISRAEIVHVWNKDIEILRSFTEEEQELAKFSRQVLASTEDVWTKVFQKMGKTYTPPTLVLFTNSVSSACGEATSSVGPFYCSGDQKLYIDLSFFTEMKSQLGADGDFSYAYVIAHEVGHHVENLLGTLNAAHVQMNKVSQTEANKISVRLELLADYYAGVWGHYENATYGSLETGDIEEAIDCAEKIGDNYLQKKARGYVQPESFTHGTSAQRMKWLKKGLDTGDMNTTTFGIPESAL